MMGDGAGDRGNRGRLVSIYGAGASAATGVGKGVATGAGAGAATGASKGATTGAGAGKGATTAAFVKS